MSVVALVGAQYGSEGKGAVAAYLADRFDVHVRVGGPNAGHTYQIPDKLVARADIPPQEMLKPQYFVSQQLPCGWINTESIVVIGRGAVVDVERLAMEVREASLYDPTVGSRLFIDEGAWPITPEDAKGSDGGGINGSKHRSIGSTGKGVGAARIRRLERIESDLHEHAASSMWSHSRNIKHHVEIHAGLAGARVVDTRGLLRGLRQIGRRILLEGTQGSGLSFTHGPWPYVTTEDTNAGALLTAVGLPPDALDLTILVVRAHPIRVAGNSGPLPNEITWEELSERTGGYVKPEKTTVTKKVRRVADFDRAVVEEAVAMNGRCVFALTFADYLEPGLRDQIDGVTVASSPPVAAMIEELEDIRDLEDCNVRVVLIGTGPGSMVERHDERLLRPTRKAIL